MKNIRAFISLTAIILAFAGSARPDDVTVLYTFDNSASEGASPLCKLTRSDTILYGTTYQTLGGGGGGGTVFKIDTVTRELTLLHVFSGADGERPYGSVTLSGNMLYGTTAFGGNNNKGTIFQIDTDTNNFTSLYSFAAGTSPQNPFGTLTASGGKLYGMTAWGGEWGAGTIFTYDTSTNDLTLLHSFTGTSNGGANPYGGLTLSGTVLYGMTNRDSSDGFGTGNIFKFDTADNSFSVLHHFAGGAEDGRRPEGELTLSGTTLYGMTPYGGSSDEGTIFKLDTLTNDYSLLHSFTYSGTEGGEPFGGLTLAGDYLYGMTAFGGTSDCGTIFRIKTNGTDFSTLYSFAGSDGQFPMGTFTLYNGTLFATTGGDGVQNTGNIFSFPTSEYTAISDHAGDLGLRLSQEEIGWLSQLYFDGKSGLNPVPVTINGIQWEYFPDHIAGKNPGDAWEEDGVYYFYFGSGVKGEPLGGGTGDVPEPSTLLLLLPFIGFGVRRLEQKKI